MASRQVRKLLQQQREKDLLAHAGSEEEEEEEQTSQAPFNPFDLLSDEDDKVAGPAQDEEEEADDADAEEQQQAVATKPVPNKQGAGGGGKKGKKKKGKGKGKGDKAAGDGDAEAAAVAPDNTEELEDIDRLVQELNLKTVGAEVSASVSGQVNGTTPRVVVSSTRALLAVDAQALRGDDELRRIFGASVVAAVDREEVADAARRRRNVAQARGRPQAAAALRRMGRRGLLVTPKEHWPPLDSGISMEFTGIEDGVRHFRYKWSPNYRQVQRAFEQCQASHDPNAIAALLQHAPYHVDALLAMYDLYRHLGENQYAEEVLLRSLYVLESAWHPEFDVRAAQCRLDFEVEENRALYLALFRHVQGLSRAGCHKTAQECAKLLLALEPEDPMGVLCMMDYLAIRAGRPEYLHEFVAGWEPDPSLALRPNYAYGLAMSALRMEQQQQQGASSSSSSSTRPTAPPQPASQLLLNAILMHPSVVPRLLSKLQEKGTGREGHWTKLLQRKLFTSPHDQGSSTLQHLASIYVERSALLWKAPDALELLRTAATRAADVSEAGAVRKSGTAAVESSEEGASVSVDDWKCVRQQAFPDDHGKNEFRHLRLADFSDNVNALPREELAMGPVAPPPDAAAAAAAAAAGGGGRVRGVRQGGGGGGGHGGVAMDDIDPAVLEEIQEQIALAQAQQMQQQQQQGGGVPVQAPQTTDEEMRAGNPLMMLLRSLLPWVNVGQQPDYTQDDDDDEQEQEQDGNAAQRRAQGPG